MSGGSPGPTVREGDPSAGGAQRRQLRIDVTEQSRLFGVVQEGALESVPDHVGDLVQLEPQVLPGPDVLFGHGRAAHEPIVRVQAHDEASVVILADRMTLEGRDGPGLDVARQANLQRDPEGVHVRHQVLVLEETGPVSDPLCPAVVDRLVDRLRTIRLAGVDGRADIRVSDPVESVLVFLGRVVVLGAGKIERYDTAVLVRDCQIGEVPRDVGIHVPDPADDEVRPDAQLRFRALHPAERRVHRLRQRKSACRVEDRRISDLHVPHVLRGGVLAELVGDALQRR